MNLIEVNNDILKDCVLLKNIIYILQYVMKKIYIYFNKISKGILTNVLKNKKYVEKQLIKLDNNFLDYIAYWNEKYYEK